MSLLILGPKLEKALNPNYKCRKSKKKKNTKVVFHIKLILKTKKTQTNDGNVKVDLSHDIVNNIQ